MYLTFRTFKSPVPSKEGNCLYHCSEHFTSNVTMIGQILTLEVWCLSSSKYVGLAFGWAIPRLEGRSCHFSAGLHDLGTCHCSVPSHDKRST